MTTPADSHRPQPFAPRLHPASEPRLGISEYDALADLFLGDDEAYTTGPTPPGSTEQDPPQQHDAPVHSFVQARASTPDTEADPTVEAVLVGHLPVRAQFWVMQHARAAADETGQTVAVLRCIGDEISLDLLAPTATRRSFNSFDARSLDEALAIAGRTAQRWLVTVDELSESQLVASSDLDRITLLTSADRPAVLAAYRTLKRTLAADGAPDRTVRVVFMGSDPKDAKRAANQIAHAASTFLSTEIDIACGSERIDATRAVPLYRGRLDRAAEPESVLDMIRRSRTLAPSNHNERVERSVKAQREPAAEPKRCSVAGAPERLCSLIEGLTDLPLACPIEPDLQLALDADNRIHLLASAAMTDPVRSLTQGASWASLNRQLILAAAQRDTSAPPAEPIMHLLVDDVPANRRLLDSPIRLHLLRSVEGAGPTPVWFAAPLN